MSEGTGAIARWVAGLRELFRGEELDTEEPKSRLDTGFLSWLFASEELGFGFSQDPPKRGFISTLLSTEELGQEPARNPPSQKGAKP